MDDLNGQDGRLIQSGDWKRWPKQISLTWMIVCTPPHPLVVMADTMMNNYWTVMSWRIVVFQICRV